MKLIMQILGNYELRDRRHTIRNELGRIHQITLAGPAGRLQQTTRLTDAQAKLFRDCAMPLPPKMIGLQTFE
ncbi:hypothetical protein ABT187_46365 [Streptomyces sp. NPDC001817]|uniref:hypothetical protein n=1 Tax=Streptomyces sp. NPDC001817 TaxID=3154398 RepID=UPI0033293985